MSDTTEQIAQLVNELVSGWSERVEYMERVKVHNDACRRAQAKSSHGQIKHWDCNCPTTIEVRAKTVKQWPILAQMQASIDGYSPVVLGGPRTTPDSKPPATLDMLDLMGSVDTFLALQSARGTSRGEKLRSLVTISRELTQDDARQVKRELKRLIKTARIMLQYEVPKRPLRDTVCGECSGTLVVATDAESDVICTGTDDTAPCGQIYRRWQWVELLEQDGMELEHE